MNDDAFVAMQRVVGIVAYAEAQLIAVAVAVVEVDGVASYDGNVANDGHDDVEVEVTYASAS